MILGKIRFKSVQYHWFNVDWKTNIKRFSPPKSDGNFYMLTHNIPSGIHPVYTSEPYRRRRYTASIDPATENIHIVDHMDILSQQRNQDKMDAIDAQMKAMCEMLRQYDFKIKIDNKDILTGLPPTP